MRFHVGLSFRPKDFIKWGVLIVGGILAFFGLYSKANALTLFTPNTTQVTTPYSEAYYVCDNTTDLCTYLTDNTTGSTGNIPWASGTIEGQDFSSPYDYTVGAIRTFSIVMYNNSTSNVTIPANSFVTVNMTFVNLDKFTKGSNFSNPGIAMRNTSNGWSYVASNQSFVCNGNSCTLTYKTPNVATKGFFIYWNDTTNMNNFFLRNDTSINYKLQLSSYSFSYENSTADTTNAINNQTQVINSWSSTINNSINKVGDNLGKIINNSVGTTNDLITDSSVDDKSGFFTNFSDNSHGLSGIVSAPLVLVRGLNSGTSCDPLTFSILGQSVSMPSGCILWDDVPSSIETIYFVFIGGFFGYILVTKLFHDVNRLKDPSDSEVSTLDL